MGSQHQDTIEINGKKYDAVTGRIIGEKTQKSGSAPHTPKTQPSQKSTGVALDGFMRVKKHPTTPRTAVHKHKTVQKSQTLMRSAVKRPSSSPKTTPAAPGVSKLSLGPSKHLARAATNIHKNPMVSRYGDVTHRSSVIKKTEHLPVKTPIEHPTQHHTAVQKAPTTHPVVSAHHTTQTSRSKASSVLIEKALASATSHEQPAHVTAHKTKRRKKLAHRIGVSSRAMALSSSVLAGVLLGGFFAVQNVPNLSMRVAAARAGFDASMPAYKPSGFSFKGPINYSPGVVTVSFKSNTDDRGYSVTERSSNWNSDALLANYVVAEGKQYQTYIDRGRTLYIYDGSNATWVDNGIWYQVEGQSDMTTDQLVRIAASI
ncbi:hypothetical protein KC959_03850 [Candidatus Saccharibacteria bacterium]|nr:hypothetical protein [Candidatus Saccharibacteria bacterium]